MANFNGVVRLTKQQYKDLKTKDPNTLYVTVDEPTPRIFINNSEVSALMFESDPQTQLNNKANSSDVVYKSTTQSITGNKNFTNSSGIRISGKYLKNNSGVLQWDEKNIVTSDGDINPIFTILWSSASATTGTFDLTQSIDNFDFLVFTIKRDDTRFTMYTVPVNAVKLMYTTAYAVYSCDGSTRFQFPSSTTVNVAENYYSWLSGVAGVRLEHA